MDRAVIATAEELFAARHFSSVVALANDALDAEPDCVLLRVLRARAHIALRRDLDAQADLRDIIRLDPQCGIAYRLLGELAARRDENESAGIFFREAVRLDPADREARDWLQIVDASSRQSAPRIPSGRFPPTRAQYERPRSEPSLRTLSSPARKSESQEIRLARGTQPPIDDDERPTARTGASPAQIARTTKPAVRGSGPAVWKTPEPARAVPPPLPLPPPPPTLPNTLTGVPLPVAPAKPAPRLVQRPPTRNPIPELPGFGDDRVAAGILTRERLRAAQAYQRSMKVQLSTAIVTLGLATPQRIEWAAVSHQSELGQRQG